MKLSAQYKILIERRLYELEMKKRLLQSRLRQKLCLEDKISILSLDIEEMKSDINRLMRLEHE